ncbi:helix-turn-helix transcriptional regulator [Endothiovibrio diazotrophicus]
MDRFKRIYQLHKLLVGAHVPVSRRRIEEELECSQATFKRVRDDLRDTFGAPVEYDRTRNGYYYDRRQGERPFELPGLWFNASELQALLTARQLLAEVQPGLLDRQLEPLRERIAQLLAKEQPGGNGDVAHRVRILSQAGRSLEPEAFQRVAAALMGRKRLRIRYHARGDDRESVRTVSPQRLVHYRDNWYLDAWCHEREALRSFAVERIREAHPQGQPAQEIPDERLDHHFSDAYGIFSGPVRQAAILRFTSTAARWVADERWHRDQRGEWLDDGSWRLEVPYSDPTELVMEILRHGAEVVVEGPDELRAEVARRLREAAARYRT